MVKIPPSKEAKRQKPARRRPVIPSWVPLTVAVVGLAVSLAPDGVSWWMRVAGVAMLAAGSFWLGQDQQHDPADRSRIMQLEQQLIRFGVLERDLDLRKDVAAALRAQRGRPPAPPEEHGADERDDRSQPGAGQLRAVSGGREPDLDAPLPGERE